MNNLSRNNYKTIYKQIRGCFCRRLLERFGGEVKDALDKTIASYKGDFALTFHDSATELSYCDSKLKLTIGK